MLALAFLAVVGALTGVLYWAFVRTSSRSIQSVAVMPFANTSGNADLEYLSEGMTETLINNLSRVPGLSVKARSSVYSYRGKEITPKQIGQELGVQALLNGRVLQRGDQLTLSLELVDTSTGDQIWGEKYDRRMADLTALQGEIARDVSGKLQSRLSGSDRPQVAKNYTENVEAYQLYLKGKYYWNKRTGQDTLKSIEYFQQAIDKDPTYALAYSGLAEAYVLLPAYTGESAAVAYPRARAAARRALEIDDQLAEAHTALANISSEFDWDFAAAEAGFKRAIAINPNYATAHQWYGEYLMAMGRFPDAVAEIRRAQEVDPLSLIINGLLGVALNLNGQLDEAIEQIKKTIDLDPNFPRSHIFLAEAYQQKGRYNDAIEEFAKVSRFAGMPPEVVNQLSAQTAEAYKREGPAGYYRAMAELFGARRNTKTDQPPPVTVIAGYWVQAGEHDKALQMLESALQKRDPDLLRLNGPHFDPIRNDPRFIAIVKQIGLPDRPH
jgi:TolB-like protein/Flp pilus assembly protein TadD